MGETSTTHEAGALRLIRVLGRHDIADALFPSVTVAPTTPVPVQRDEHRPWWVAAPPRPAVVDRRGRRFEVLDEWVLDCHLALEVARDLSDPRAGSAAEDVAAGALWRFELGQEVTDTAKD